MRIYLARHGEAVSKEEDDLRPLSEQGRADVKRVGEALKQNAVSVSAAFHSGKTRAQQTVEILAAAIAPQIVPQEIPGLQPFDDPREVYAKIESLDEDALFVGHLPHMGNLLMMMLDDSAKIENISFGPGALFCVEGSPQTGWKLVLTLHPDAINLN